MEKDVKKMSIQEIKAILYDQIVMFEKLKNNITILENELVSRGRIITNKPQNKMNEEAKNEAAPLETEGQEGNVASEETGTDVQNGGIQEDSEKSNE